MLAKKLDLGPGADLWPLQPDTWTDEVFYGLIEVLHDLVQRPRKRSWHDYGSCGWHYDRFTLEPAQRLYRWRVNQLLPAAGIELRLAEAGEDVGRLVEAVDGGRTDLVDRLLAPSGRASHGRVQHAIARFRDRVADEHAKRSAIVDLAGVLEDRRQLLKAELFKKDEGALFQIANEFDIRHHSERQKTDYDPASSTGCSGGIWPPSSSPTGSSTAKASNDHRAGGRSAGDVVEDRGSC